MGTLTFVIITTVNGEPSPGTTILNNSTIALSLATNLFATLLIAYKLWCVNVASLTFVVYMIHRTHRKVIRDLGLGKRQSHVQNVLILLVESGTIYLGFQVSVRR